jgi:hypothetical protein
MPHFYCKLNAPRPGFAFDMSKEEQGLMAKHAAYWQSEIGKSVVVFGPVFDPAGPFGLGIVEAQDEATVRKFQAGDPVIAAERGFSYDVFLMQAVTPASASTNH